MWKGEGKQKKSNLQFKRVDIFNKIFNKDNDENGGVGSKSTSNSGLECLHFISR